MLTKNKKYKVEVFYSKRIDKTVYCYASSMEHAKNIVKKQTTKSYGKNCKNCTYRVSEA